MVQKEKFISAAVIFLSAAIISAFTAVSLIFFDVADYVYLNIIGLFIICVYFGFTASIFYLVGFTGFMIKFGLADAFFSYSLVLGVVNAAIIAFCCKMEVKFRKILVASVVMALFSKIATSEIYALLSGDEFSGVAFAISLEKVIAQARIYLFSGFCTVAYFYIFNKIVWIFKNKISLKEKN